MNPVLSKLKARYVDVSLLKWTTDAIDPHNELIQGSLGKLAILSILL